MKVSKLKQLAHLKVVYLYLKLSYIFSVKSMVSVSYIKVHLYEGPKYISKGMLILQVVLHVMHGAGMVLHSP